MGKKLELPYERTVMEVEQVRDETINFYEKLCDFIDEELKNNRSSLNKEVKRIERKGGYYGNILYTIYCISEGHVTKKYSGNYNYYNYEYSYKILEEHLGKNLKNKVFIKAQQLESRILPPNEDTLEYFNLTENGLKREWWDKNGKLRAKREFNEKELNILNVTPGRSTIVWDINEVNKHIIFLYLEIWNVIASGLGKDLKWKKRKRKILKNLIDGKYEYFLDYENGNILASLLKISENTIRRVMPNTQILKTSNEINNVKNYLPKEILLDIKNKLIEYKTSFDDEELNKILLDMIKNSPSDWRLKVKQIITAEDDKKINILIGYREDRNFIKIAKQVIKETDNEDLLLICLYGIEREEKLSQKNKKLLESIIYPSNINVYENILNSKEVLSLELFNKLKEIKNPIRKKIELDMDKVEQSKQELNQTVKIVKKYIGDEAEKKEIKYDKVEVKDDKVKGQVVEAVCDDKLEVKYRNFLKLILSSGVVSVEEGKKIAMNNGALLNAFISDINRELYEDIQDQVIMIEDDYIKIDDFYVDMIKELVMNEK